ncbi:MAG TPA: HEPN domain-containing protein [Pirellulales bacterium]|nr:HEPN domain-containing protein [Pirellulales bacterium]
MMTKELAGARDRINSLLARVAEIDDAEMQSHWARYLCVLVCGFLEVAVAELFMQYAENRAEPKVARFVAKHLRRFQNPKMARILTVIGEFSTEWRDEIELATNGQLADAVNSVVANRHLIAHGRSVGISYVRVKDYFASVLKVVELLDAQLA